MHNTALYTIEPSLRARGAALFLGFKLIRQQSKGCKQLTRAFRYKKARVNYVTLIHGFTVDKLQLFVRNFGRTTKVKVLINYGKRMHLNTKIDHKLN